ncbi:MAG: lipocalin family protein [Bacteroidales bacterium]|nr:lipocalin family protein [Bacteroidales bacterium]
MKKILYFIFCFVALGCFCSAMCSDDNDGENNGNNGNNGGYSAEMFVGTWLVENMTVDGENMTPQNMLFIMNEDGTGLANDNGVTENNGFAWSISGDQLTITPRSGTNYVYTVNSLTENECTFSGTNVPMADFPGNVVVHLTRVR